MAVSQAELGRLFVRTQQWVSKQQKRTIDPMPRDLEGATVWGRKHGFLADIVTATLTEPEPDPRELADVDLKRKRIEDIDFDLRIKRGEFIKIADVRDRARQASAAFRLVACQYPARAKATIERHVTDPAAVEAIMRDLQPLAADLLNAADPQALLAGVPPEVMRAVMTKRAMEWVEEVLACLP